MGSRALEAVYNALSDVNQLEAYLRDEMPRSDVQRWSGAQRLEVPESENLSYPYLYM